MSDKDINNNKETLFEQGDIKLGDLNIKYNKEKNGSDYPAEIGNNASIMDANNDHNNINKVSENYLSESKNDEIIKDSFYLGETKNTFETENIVLEKSSRKNDENETKEKTPEPSYDNLSNLRENEDDKPYVKESDIKYMQEKNIPLNIQESHENSFNLQENNIQNPSVNYKDNMSKDNISLNEKNLSDHSNLEKNSDLTHLEEGMKINMHEKNNAHQNNNVSSSNSKLDDVLNWVEYRLPIVSSLKHFAAYRTPRNLSYAWSFGSLAGIALVIQILTGLFLAMHYTPHVKQAFESVENIMRNVNFGWLIRYMHAVGASMFFIVVYMHIMRGLYYGSYKRPRELVWFFGIILFLAMMATAFMGYVLPWGQMSFWGATVITNLFSAIPIIGETIVTWLWGGFSVDNPTLNRFFALHFLLPFLIVGIVLIHIAALHVHGSNNPTGLDVKSERDTIPFHPYYTIKDFVGFGAYFIVFCYFTFFLPNSLGHPDNYIPADPMVTPAHIVPEWYFLPFYAILRAVPDKLGGVIAMFGAIAILFFLPWLDSSPVRSGRYRPLFKKFYIIFIIDFLLLGYIGGRPAEQPYIAIGQVATIYYFTHFLIILPLLSKFEKTLPLPNSIYEATKHGEIRT